MQRSLRAVQAMMNSLVGTGYSIPLCDIAVRSFYITVLYCSQIALNHCATPQSDWFIPLCLVGECSAPQTYVAIRLFYTTVLRCRVFYPTVLRRIVFYTTILHCNRIILLYCATSQLDCSTPLCYVAVRSFYNTVLHRSQIVLYHGATSQSDYSVPLCYVAVRLFCTTVLHRSQIVLYHCTASESDCSIPLS